MATPTIFVVAGGVTYSFPSCAVTWDGVHNLFEVPLPKTTSPEMVEEVGSFIKSLNIVQESFRLVGNWRLSVGETALSRAVGFVSAFNSSQDPAVFSWGVGSATVTRNVYLKEWHFDEVPGEGDQLRYNIVLAAARTEITT